MSTTVAPDELAAVPAVRLDDLEDRAGLQTRIDRKYLVPMEQLSDVFDRIAPRLQQLEINSLRTFRYETVYFDDAGYTSYLAAARRGPRRFKVRTRAYLDSGQCVLEVKTRNRRGQTHKHRRAYDLECRRLLTPEGADFVAASIDSSLTNTGLVPVLTTGYSRRTFLVDPGASRLTIDTGLEWFTPTGLSTSLSDMALIESKVVMGPSTADRILWASGYRPVRISKYCTGLAALHPGLPANKWNRVLRRHFGRE